MSTSKRRSDGGMPLEDAIEYAKNLVENVNIMKDPKTDFYHVIREFGIEHWKQHYINIAEIRIKTQIKFIIQKDKKEPTTMDNRLIQQDARIQPSS